MPHVLLLTWTCLLATRLQDPADSSPPAAEKTTETAPVPDEQPTFILATGQITDLIGAGLRSVQVTAFTKDANGSEGKQIAQTTTDAMGDFVLKADGSLGKTEILVKFSKEQFTDLTTSFFYDPDKPPTFLGDALRGNLAIKGKVISAVDQSPVAAKVVFENLFTREEVETNAGGGFEIGGLSPMQGELEVTSSGYGRERKAVRVPVAGELAVELKPERTVAFTIVNEAGAPLPGAVIECIDAAHHDVRTLVTGDDGSAQVRGLHFDATRLGVRLSREGYVTKNEQAVALPADRAESQHQLILERAGTISGRVSDAGTDAPLYGARVFAGDVYTDSTPRDWTDTKGRYTLTGIRAGDTCVTVHFAGRAPEMKSVTASAGETATLDFSLQVASFIRGTVKNTDGEPLPGMEVAATQWRGKNTLGLRAITDREGNFLMENVPVDEFELAVVGVPGVKPQSVRAGGQATCEFTVDASAFRAPVTLLGKPAPEFELKTLDGFSIPSKTLKGKTVLLIFWATWCAPCVAEIPTLMEIHERFRGRNDFIMIGASRDFEESDLRNFLKERPKISWPQAFGEGGGVRAAAQVFGVTGIPSIYLIDKEGKIIADQLRDDQILAEVQKTLGVDSNP